MYIKEGRGVLFYNGNYIDNGRITKTKGWVQDRGRGLLTLLLTIALSLSPSLDQSITPIVYICPAYAEIKHCVFNPT